MKERIRLLAEQADFIFWGNEDWKPEGAVIDWSSVYDKELEKFAQLIVQECAEHLEYVESSLDRHKWPSPSKCGEYIKEHFGIEE